LSHFFENAQVNLVSRLHRWRSVPFFRSTCDVLARSRSGSPLTALAALLALPALNPRLPIETRFHHFDPAVLESHFEPSFLQAEGLEWQWV